MQRVVDALSKLSYAELFVRYSLRRKGFAKVAWSHKFVY